MFNVLQSPSHLNPKNSRVALISDFWNVWYQCHPSFHPRSSLLWSTLSWTYYYDTKVSPSHFLMLIQGPYWCRLVLVELGRQKLLTISGLDRRANIGGTSKAFICFKESTFNNLQTITFFLFLVESIKVIKPTSMICFVLLVTSIY